MLLATLLTVRGLVRYSSVPSGKNLKNLLGLLVLMRKSRS